MREEATRESPRLVEQKQAMASVSEVEPVKGDNVEGFEESVSDLEDDLFDEGDRKRKAKKEQSSASGVEYKKDNETGIGTLIDKAGRRTVLKPVKCTVPADMKARMLLELAQGVKDGDLRKMSVNISEDAGGPVGYRANEKLILSICKDPLQARVYGGSWNVDGAIAADRVAAYPTKSIEDMPATKEYFMWLCEREGLELSDFDTMELNVYYLGDHMKAHHDGEPVSTLFVGKIPIGELTLDDAKLMIHPVESNSSVLDTITGVGAYVATGDGLPYMQHSHEMTSVKDARGREGLMLSFVFRGLQGNNDRQYNDMRMKDMKEQELTKQRVVGNYLTEMQKLAMQDYESDNLYELLNSEWMRSRRNPYEYLSGPQDPILPPLNVLQAQGLSCYHAATNNTESSLRNEGTLTQPGTVISGTANPEFFVFLRWHLLSYSGAAIHTKGVVIRSAMLRQVSRVPVMWETWREPDPTKMGAVGNKLRWRKTCWLESMDNNAVIYTEMKATAELDEDSVLNCAPFPVFVADSSFGRPAVCFVGMFKCTEAKLEAPWLLLHLVQYSKPLTKPN